MPASTKIVDIGGDHRYVDGWTYGLADVWPDQIKGKTRIANPGCYPAATLTALAPLLAAKLIEPHGDHHRRQERRQRRRSRRRGFQVWLCGSERRRHRRTGC